MEENSAGAIKSRAKLFPRCSICGLIPERGIRGGIRLKKGFICHACEKDIVSLTADTCLYEEIKEKIKALIK